MPEMDGLEAARRIQEAHGAQRPQIIALTANAMQGDRERTARAGMDDYVSKPIRIRDLQAALAAAGSRLQKRLGIAAAAGGIVSPPSRAPTAVDLEQAAILDPTAFDEAREFLGDEADEVIGGVIDSFQRRTPEMLQTLRRTLAGGDHTQLPLVVHTLKGLSGTVGARRIQALCERLEADARSGAFTDMAPVLDRLEEELAQANTALARDPVAPTRNYSPPRGHEEHEESKSRAS